KIEGGFKLVPRQKPDRFIEIMGVPVLFQDVLGPLDADHVVKGKHLVCQHLIRGPIDVDISVLFRLAAQPRSAEQLQKAQLQLLRLQGKHIVKGFFEGIAILLRQSGDQVQMLDDLSPSRMLRTVQANFSKFCLRWISSLVRGLVDCTPISKRKMPGGAFSFRNLTISGRRMSAVISNWKTHPPWWSIKKRNSSMA